MDYYNVFRDMKKALKDYAQGSKDKKSLPIQKKDHLFTRLAQAIEDTQQFCLTCQISLTELSSGDRHSGAMGVRR